MADQKTSKLDDWKSRKLWFHIAAFVAGVTLAAYGSLTPTAAGFIVAMAGSYGASNTIAKKFAAQGGQ